MVEGRFSNYFIIVLLFNTRVLYKNNTSHAVKSINFPKTPGWIYRISTSVIWEYPPIKSGAILEPNESLNKTSFFSSGAFGLSMVINDSGPDKNIS